MVQNIRRWLVLALLIGSLTAPLWAAGQSMTIFFQGKSITVDGIYRGDVVFYPVEQISGFTGVRCVWNESLKQLNINGAKPSIDSIELGGQHFLPLEAFVECSGLVATWDVGRSTLVLHRPGDKMPSSAAGLSTPSNPVEVNDPTQAPFDSSLQGRLPAGWHMAPLIDRAAPPPGPAGSNHLPVAAVLDRRSNNTTNEVYIPRSGRNAAFQVTITDVTRVDNLRGYYQPKGGHRFVLVHLSQKNLTNTAQVDPGKFYLQDGGGNNYEALDELSSVRPVIFRPYGINFGYLVYEVPETVAPVRIVLTTVGASPLSVNL